MSIANKYTLLQSTFNAWKNNILEFVNKKAERIKKFKLPEKTNPLLKNSEILKELKIIQDKFVIVPIDKAASNIAFTCKKYYIQRLLLEVEIIGKISDTYKYSNINLDGIILNNNIINDRVGLKL